MKVLQNVHGTSNGSVDRESVLKVFRRSVCERNREFQYKTFLLRVKQERTFYDQAEPLKKRTKRSKSRILSRTRLPHDDPAFRPILCHRLGVLWLDWRAYLSWSVSHDYIFRIEVEMIYELARNYAEIFAVRLSPSCENGIIGKKARDSGKSGQMIQATRRLE